MDGSHNKSLRVKQLIAQSNDIQWPVPDKFVRVAKNLTALACDHNIEPDMPSLDAGLSDCGRAIAKWHDKVRVAAKPYRKDDVFIMASHSATSSKWLELMRGGTSTAIVGSAEFTKDMIEAWLIAANQYAENRIKSARRQLQNADVPEADIATLLANPMRIRAYINSQRHALIVKLRAIQAQISANDPTNLATAKDVQLLEKHKHWLDDDGTDNSDYMPNDGAVDYPMLFTELVYLVIKAGCKGFGTVWATVEFVLRIMQSAMLDQSSRAGWAQLATIGDFDFNGIAVGKIVRDYVTDDTRNIKSLSKQSSPVGRSPLRTSRMASCVFSMQGPFSLLNYDLKRVMEALIKHRALERQIEELSKEAKFIKAGAEGFSIAEATAWLLVLDRPSLFSSVTGRNDLSAPKILSDITQLKMDAFGSLRPRTWALMEDITGIKSTGPSIEGKWGDAGSQAIKAAATPTTKSVATSNQLGTDDSKEDGASTKVPDDLDFAPEVEIDGSDEDEEASDDGSKDDDEGEFDEETDEGDLEDYEYDEDTSVKFDNDGSIRASTMSHKSQVEQTVGPTLVPSLSASARIADLVRVDPHMSSAGMISSLNAIALSNSKLANANTPMPYGLNFTESPTITHMPIETLSLEASPGTGGIINALNESLQSPPTSSISPRSRKSSKKGRARRKTSSPRPKINK